MPETAWLIESAIHDEKGPYYLCLVPYKYVPSLEWRPDHQLAIRFGRAIDADRLCDWVRSVRPDLFPTINPYPKAIEHVWTDPASLPKAEEEAR